MAILNANFNNGDYLLSGSKRVITCTSNQITGNFSYRFYLELEYNGNTYAYTFRPNNNLYGIINITKILQTIVEPTAVQEVLTVPDAVSTTGTVNDIKQNIHSIPHEKYDLASTSYIPQYISTANTGAARVTARLYDFYSTTATGTPSKQGAAIQQYLQVITGRGLETDLINKDFEAYKLTTNTKKFITGNYNLEATSIYSINVDRLDFGTLTFLNRTQVINLGALTESIWVRYYNAAGDSLAFQELENLAAYGGEYSQSGSYGSRTIIIAGVYPANLDKLPATYERPIDRNISGVNALAYYDVFTSSGAAVTDPKSSCIYRFNIVDRCEKYEAQRFAYINTLGAWEYITFNEKRTDTRRSKNTKITSSIFDYEASYGDITTGYNEKPYTSGVGHSSEKIVSSNIVDSFTINTGYLSTSDAAKVEDLFISNLVHYINQDGTARAVILTSSSLPFVKNKNKHYSQIKYTLNFTYSVQTYNNLIY